MSAVQTATQCAIGLLRNCSVGLSQAFDRDSPSPDRLVPDGQAKREWRSS